MLPPGVSLGVGFGLADCPRIGVSEPFSVGGKDCLPCIGVPFRAAVAPSSAFAAPLIEKAGPYPATSEDDDSGRGGGGWDGLWFT